MTRSGLQRCSMALVAVALLGVATPSALAGKATATRALTIYAVANRAQYADHADDRVRGDFHNPFNVDSKIPNVKGKGAQAGDNALYSFKLYSDAAFKNRIGSAVYSCVINFAHRALCEADFQLNGDAMFASGPANFDSTRFTLAVSGGTGSYLGARGQVSSAPTVANAHRLTFILR
jgi:hypothetical protein